VTGFNYEDLGDSHFDSDRDVCLASIAVSLKRIADALTAEWGDTHLSPLEALSANMSSITHALGKIAGKS
jgi:hypothetical protein